MPEPIASPALTPARAVKWGIFLGVLALVIYLCLRILQPFVGVLAWAIVLSTIFHPAHRALVRRTGMPTMSALVTSLLVALVVVGPLVTIAAVAVDQVLALRTAAQQMLASPGEVTGPTGQALEWVTRNLRLDARSLVAWVATYAAGLAQATAQYTLSVAAGVTGAVVSFVFVLFAVFFLLRDGERLLAGIPTLLPFEPARSEALLTHIAAVIYAGVYGIVAIALIQGVLCGGMFWVLGIPSAAVWGLMAALAGIIPVAGAALVWVPGAAYLAAQGEWTRAIVLAAWGGAVVSSVDNFLRPRLVGGRVGLSQLVIFFALLGGVQLFGLLGIVLGPVLFAVVIAVVTEVLQPSIAGRRDTAR